MPTGAQGTAGQRDSLYACVGAPCASLRIVPVLMSCRLICLCGSLPLGITDHIQPSILQLLHNCEDLLQWRRLHTHQGVGQAQRLPLVAAQQVVRQQLYTLQAGAQCGSARVRVRC